MVSRIEGDMNFAGKVTFLDTVTLYKDSITDQHIAPSAKIQASKLVHRHVLVYAVPDGQSVSAITRLLYLAAAAGKLRRVEVRPTQVPTGDYSYTVDVQRASDGSGTWSSLLSSVITVDSSASADTKKSGTLVASPDLAAGDALRLVITTSGTSGTQGQGLVVLVELEEDPS